MYYVLYITDKGTRPKGRPIFSSSQTAKPAGVYTRDQSQLLEPAYLVHVIGGVTYKFVMSGGK